MIRLRLFSAAEPGRQLDQRMVGADAITVGRDPGADWVIHDPERALSRRHCTVRAAGEGAGVRDLSANGTFLGDGAERVPQGSEVMVPPGGSIRMGTFTLQVEALAADIATPAPRLAPASATPPLFAPLRGMEPVAAPQRPQRIDPFASQLAPDPLIADHRPGDRVSLSDGDAWDQRPAARAGDWDLPKSPVSHENLIGMAPTWTEPPRAERDAGFGFDAPFDRPILAAPASTAGALAIPMDWAEPPRAPEPAAAPALPPVASTPAPVAAAVPAPPPPVAAAQAGTSADDLFAAFCAGARLSPSAFAGEDPAAVLARLGEVYRGMVLGLADLMSERTALKNEYRMTRTMVRAEGNNPFKWAPPQRLAIDVLRGGEGFTTGGEAVQEGFRDIKAHLLCMLAGMRAALGATLTALSPSATEGAIEGRSFLIKAQREAALWTEYTERYERFKRDADDSADGAVNRAFRTAYEQQLAQLHAAGTGYGPASGRG